MIEADAVLVSKSQRGDRAAFEELVRRTAQEYLRPENRTILTLLPGKATETQGAAK